MLNSRSERRKRTTSGHHVAGKGYKGKKNTGKPSAGKKFDAANHKKSVTDNRQFSKHIILASPLKQSALDSFCIEFSYNVIPENESGVTQNELNKKLTSVRSFVVLLREEFDRELIKLEMESFDEVGASDNFVVVDLEPNKGKVLASRLGKIRSL
jgi:hypothetical protein